MHAASLTLSHQLRFTDLYSTEGLAKVDTAFLSELSAADHALHEKLLQARAAPASLPAKDESQLMMDVAPHLEDFVGTLFGIRAEVAALAAQHHTLAPVFTVKRQFVQRRAAKIDNASTFDGNALFLDVCRLIDWKHPIHAGFEVIAFETCYASAVSAWLAKEETSPAIQTALHYAAWALHTPAGRARHAHGVLFHVPHKIDPATVLDPLLNKTIADGCTTFTIKPEHIRRRVGFNLTDAGTDLAGALSEANYCIWCHHQGKDSCSKGLKEKPAADGTVAFKKSVFGVKLAGCPLEERISEFHETKVAGYAIGALAIITVDNPMVAATGHRICNDCMKACIYQKQEPVDIPQAETRTLKDVLALPYGFEIYSLFTRWNPLNFKRWIPLARTGKRVLVVGMGPAGFALSHHLMNDGHTVVGIDGLKIEPLAPELGGVAADGSRHPFAPVRDFASIQEPLGTRIQAGFGGVAEYGITVRWDKNFLKVIRLLLERRAQFALFGGIRFAGSDGTITPKTAWQAGFDHIALCMGAGKPTVLNIQNGLARGVRTASDFLMALQLTGAAKQDSIANLQVRLPIVVIGGGLTAIDTATESLAYYALQVEKFLQRAEQLSAGSDAFLATLQGEERAIADEFIAHARALRAAHHAVAIMGRRDDCVSQTHDRQPRLHAQS
jgi:NADPH-dependent glutamate synthase beta subunit-like oxidoreductase